MACNGLKKGSFQLFVHTKCCRTFFGQANFAPIFDPSFVAKRLIFKTFCDFGVAKMVCSGAQKGLISLICAPQMVYDHDSKNTFLTHFGHIVCRLKTVLQGILSSWSGENGLQFAQKGLISVVSAHQMVYVIWTSKFLTHF